MGILASFKPAPREPRDFLRWLLDNGYDGWVRLQTADGWSKRGVVRAYNEHAFDMIVSNDMHIPRRIYYRDVRGLKVLLDDKRREIPDF